MRGRSRVLLRNLVAIAGLLAAAAAQAHQPVMDMAPRWEDGFGIQVRHEYRTSDTLLDGDDEVSNPLDRERTIHTTWVEAVYTLQREVRFTLKVPILDQERISNVGGQAVRTRGTGLGDVILAMPLKKYWNLEGWTANLGLTPSVRLPTGSTADRFPTGDGSVDGALGLSFAAESFRYYMLADLFYWRNGRGGRGIHRGDQLGFDLNLGLHPWHRNADNAGVFVMLDFEARREARGRDDTASRLGGERVSAGPILVGYRGNWMARAEVKFQVWERVRGVQVSHGTHFNVGIGVTF